jgi:nucleoside-diphosphate-sugar epimerase
MGTVVVTGASGSLGRRVAALLARPDGPDRVIGVDANELDGLPAGMQNLRLDLATDDPDIERRLDEVFSGADAIVHLAWKTADEGKRAKAEIQLTSAANHLALERVLAAASRASVATLVHLSSATVYGAWPDNAVPLSEESPLRPNPELAFAVGKADAERVLVGWAEDHPKVAVAVLRPAPVVGATTQPLYRALTGTGVARSDDAPPRPVQFLHVDDLATAVALAVHARLRGAYNVAPDSGTTDDTARALAGGVAKVRLPGRVATMIASWGWELSRAGAPKAAQAYRTYPWVVAPDRIKAAGWVPRYSSEEALVDTDPRVHWDDLPPGKRQNYTLLVAIAAAVGVAAATGSGAVLLVRHRRAGRGGTRAS